MPKGYVELWLFTGRRENLREDKTIFKYSKVPSEEDLNVLSLKVEK